MRSDGPWTADFGVYAISADTGKLLWSNHGNGILGVLARICDYIPGFTNELRDSPKYICDQYLLTEKGRIIDITSGLVSSACTSFEEEPESNAYLFYTNKEIRIYNGILRVKANTESFELSFISEARSWSYNTSEHNYFMETNFYSFRLLDSHIALILADGPSFVPIKETDPTIIKPNTVNYSLGLIDIRSGETTIQKLEFEKTETSCRIEDVAGARLLISTNGKNLYEYEISK